MIGPPDGLSGRSSNSRRRFGLIAFDAPLVLADRKVDARQSIAALCRAFPELTVVEVRAGLPHTNVVLDRVADGLESLGCLFHS